VHFNPHSDSEGAKPTESSGEK